MERYERFKDGVTRAGERTVGTFAVGSILGLCWGLVRGSGPLWSYPIAIGANFTFLSFPCFIIREVIGDTINAPAASFISGALGGFGAMTLYSGVRRAPRAAAVFGFAGLGLEAASEAFQQYRDRRREEILEERAKIGK